MFQPAVATFVGSFMQLIKNVKNVGKADVFFASMLFWTLILLLALYFNVKSGQAVEIVALKRLEFHLLTFSIPALDVAHDLAKRVRNHKLLLHGFFR